MKSPVLLLLLVLVCAVANGEDGIPSCRSKTCPSRPHSFSILEFGAVGDGKTLNTLAFQNAVFYVKSFADKGGAQLFVPPGKWLTGSFNLTSHLTLFLDKDAVILASQEASDWPVSDPLPSYGRGIDVPAGRYRSLINGYMLNDVIITGDNGTIDGQGSIWWDQMRSYLLNHSRPHLIELESSDGILVSNLTLINSPSWTIHPVYCSNVQIQNVTINSPDDSPYTDGIVPDSSSNVCIEDCCIRVGHDAIALKSGWDEYGISYKKPASGVYIRNVSLMAPRGSALAFGSEMSGGIVNARANQLHIHNSFAGVKFKTAVGRGGYITDIIISNVDMENVEVAFSGIGDCSSHPDDGYDPAALPVIDGITIRNVVGTNITIAGKFAGIPQAPFTGFCLSDILLSVTTELSRSWCCSHVIGFSKSVFPEPCQSLRNPSNSSVLCSSLAGLESI